MMIFTEEMAFDYIARTDSLMQQWIAQTTHLQVALNQSFGQLQEHILIFDNFNQGISAFVNSITFLKSIVPSGVFSAFNSR